MRLRTWMVFSAGYVWGALTGRDRLLELEDRARDLLNSDVVRDWVLRAQSTAAGGADEAVEREADDVGQAGAGEEPEDVDEDEDEYGDSDETEDLDEELEEPVEEDHREQQPARSPQVRRRAPGRTRR